jgi:hypothetical protein
VDSRSPASAEDKFRGNDGHGAFFDGGPVLLGPKNPGGFFDGQAAGFSCELRRSFGVPKSGTPQDDKSGVRAVSQNETGHALSSPKGRYLAAQFC